ncbi:Serine/threonine-protein phosphatase 2A activator 2 [Coemansia sp. RSA 353]|nr:Serine/threonine-protein phosphatase 2A activator 2 [Coemansia sp. RSA 788]KAJ2168717.1 Serine/threonine-protein phosphatase 2A activator 2 [Coemansia sp. RSA 562]KAJ2176435.1 Serine/threonine-protein phosphatase 2A activator 2 [Coemansia sp. RSA 560]KAJ2191167.1 Serine/threonine-protein phosphatase 2A activator 2 [Coemansia sp. RSA 532]KAJ2200146.1 Serine/threonine-protein phosphatase 2A activator 2 [Coemansia sp. RSA 530]KAJ2201797.1 Serine/threonine-protein phosphatase 2A activator 2 [Co
MIPVRQILSPDDLERYLESPACTELIEFLTALNDAIIGVKTTDYIEDSPVVQNLLTLLDKIKQTNDDTPPIDTKSRFGNPAFRDFYTTCEQNLPTWLAGIVPTGHIEQVSTYLCESFGNRRRIDYGTGHELNFIAFLLCLHKLKIITPSDFPALVIHVFYKYISVMRGLQMTYWLEPAGSQGVWGLDDFHFLPFLFGSGQLRTHKHLKPKSIHNKEILEEFSPSYMYFECVRFVMSIKTGSLRWHSPMIDDISGAKSWEKVNLGLFKMFRVEVIGKLPIMQHFMFGTLIEFTGSAPEQTDCGDGCGDHGHVFAFGQEFPDCCGIKVPSAAAAAAVQSDDKFAKPRDVFTRPIPFD